MMAKKKTKMLRITLVKSPIGSTVRQKTTVRSLGLSRIHQTVEQEDTSMIRGMIDKVAYLVTVEEVES